MSGVFCLLCRRNTEELFSGNGAQCDTCGFIIRSDGSRDYCEVKSEE